MTMIGLFNNLSKPSIRAIWKSAITAFLVLVGTFATLGTAELRINTSPSLPLGLYIASSEAFDSSIEFCPAEPFASLALSRGYRDPGACSDGGAPLLKPIVARAGDVIELSMAGIAVNNALLPNTAALHVDTKGRPLTSWPPGRYTVQPGFVWVASSYNVRSFDSRYFGPVPTSSIRERLRPLLTGW
jgi:conjugative transfer signal peptidase TraF